MMLELRNVPAATLLQWGVSGSSVEATFVKPGFAASDEEYLLLSNGMRIYLVSRVGQAFSFTGVRALVMSVPSLVAELTRDGAVRKSVPDPILV